MPKNICQAETLKNAIFFFFSFKLAFYCYQETLQQKVCDIRVRFIHGQCNHERWTACKALKRVSEVSDL